ncbi:MAG TPA: cupredoxin domain-containing protein [Chloroflexota bacterium]|nr:cupredoxin domain-containing protein [Chloroflexota bacterium]
MARIVNASILALLMGFIIGVGVGGFVLVAGGYGMPTPASVFGPSFLGTARTAAAPAVAQSGQQQRTTGAQRRNELKLVATEFKFTPNTLSAGVGQPLKVVLENKGAIEHDLAFTGLTAPTGAEHEAHPLAKPGQTVSLELTPDAKGRYEFVCTIPGHKEAGMRGVLVVE